MYVTGTSKNLFTHCREENYPYTESENIFPTLLMTFQIPALTYSPTHTAWSTQLCKDMNLAKIRGAMCKNTILKL